MRPSRPVILALLSGGPALVYEVVWTREVGLVIGSQVEAISTVLAAYFAGLALGARVLGAWADRSRSPLRLYGRLEILAAVAAAASPLILRWLGGAGLHPSVALGAAAAVVVGVTFLLGGTLPALLRAQPVDVAGSARRSGRLVAANTAGAVLGVAVAAMAIPQLGLLLTAWAAAITAAAVGGIALAWASPHAVDPAPDTTSSSRRNPLVPLVVAATAGAATMAFQVLAARTASLWLGSSLYAWAVVLGLFLVGLAGGNWLAARRASAGERPYTSLGIIEAAAAVVVAAGITWAVPRPTAAAGGLTVIGLGAIAFWLLPATVLMGAAFPWFVRLSVRRADRVGASFGAVSAANTAGGIAGAVAGPFLLLPAAGLSGALVACSVANGLLGVACLALGGRERSGVSRWAWPVAAAGFVAAACLLDLAPWPAPVGGRILHVSHGRQATAVVLRQAGRRDLIVDGDPEASTGGPARRTEVLLGTLPVILHPAPESLLEVGLGSGITFGTAARFPLERLECVEIADAVLDSAAYFEPDNRGAWRGEPGRIVVRRGDGRAHLGRHRQAYDVVVANTLHPWSIGATGLYSRQYFGRVRDALRPGGVAAQWIPLARIGERDLRLIVRTFLASFAEGDVWWGADNLLLIGRVPGDATPDAPRYADAAGMLTEIGIRTRRDLLARRLASRDEALSVLGATPLLDDDRPVLEAAGLGRSRTRDPGGELAVAEAIARAGLPADAPMVTWLASRVARARGDEAGADRLETKAIDAGLAVARRSAADRLARTGALALGAGRPGDAERAFAAALRLESDHAAARLGLTVTAMRGGQGAVALRRAERLVADHPGHAEGWNMLGVLRRQVGDPTGAASAFARALDADPFFPDALANAGLLAAREGDSIAARSLLDRLEEITPFGRPEPLETLRRAVAESGAR